MKNNDTQVFAGQRVAQYMLIQILMGQIVLSAPDRGAAVREALMQGTGAIRSNPNMTETEKFDAVKRIEEAFGWAKTVGVLAQTVYRGIERVRSRFILTMTANNLARLPRLLTA